MGLQVSRKRLSVRGLGGLDLRMIDPTVWPAYLSVGWHESSKLEYLATMEELEDETGVLVDVLRKNIKTHFTSQLMQTSIDEIALIRDAGDSVFNVRFYGQPNPTTWQYYCLEQAKIAVKIPLDFKVGKRLLPLELYAMDASNAYGFSVPPFFLSERSQALSVLGLQFWFDPRDMLDVGTVYLIDVSGFQNHGTLAAAGSWQASGLVEFLRFNGSSDFADFGAGVALDNVNDALLEAWVRVQVANGNVVTFIGKKGDTTNGAGWLLGRDASNRAIFTIADGGANVSVVSTATLLQNAWHHVACQVDRNGNGQMYVDGAVSGAAVSVAAIGASTGTSTFRFARTGSTYYQTDLGGVRVALYGAGGIPANIATIVANHFAAERGYYGV